MKGNEGLRREVKCPCQPLLYPQVALLSPRLLNEAQPLADDVIVPLVLTHGLVFNAYRIQQQTPQQPSGQFHYQSRNESGKAKNELPLPLSATLSNFRLTFLLRRQEKEVRRSVNLKIICDFMYPSSFFTKVCKLCQHLHLNSFRKESLRFT